MSKARNVLRMTTFRLRYQVLKCVGITSVPFALPCAPIKIIWRQQVKGFYCITYFASVRRACSRCTLTPTAEGEMYSPTLSLTSALDGVGGQRHAPATLTLGKTQCPLYRRLGGPHGRSGRVRKISPTPGFDPVTVQSVASRYTDWPNGHVISFN